MIKVENELLVDPLKVGIDAGDLYELNEDMGGVLVVNEFHQIPQDDF